MRASRKARRRCNSSISLTRLRTHFMDMSLAFLTQIQPSAPARIYHAGNLFSARAFPVGSIVTHPAHGDGVVMSLKGFDRSVTFQNLQPVEITDTDRALAQMDGDEVDSVMELTIKHEVLSVSQLRKKSFNRLISKRFNSQANRVIEFSQLKTRHDNKHYHDAI
jgi:hypothetical protein